MDDKLLNKAITLSAKEEKLQGGKPVIKIKDEKGLTYTVYKQKKDGSTSVAWDQLQELNIGDTVQISYVEDIKDSPEYGKVTYRTIRAFNKDIGEGMMNASAHEESPRTEANRGQSARSTEDSIIRQVAFKGAIEMAVAGKIDLVAIEKYTNAFERIIQGHSSPVSESQEELPTIQTDDEPPIDSFEEPL
jgi:hypothetical protein